MNSKFITVRDLIEILNKVNSELEVVIKHTNPDNTRGYLDDVYVLVESDRVSVKDGCLVLDIS